jgi:hypothetical protein
MDTDDLTTAQKIALGGGVLTAIAALLPWVSAGRLTVTGIDGDGTLTLIFGVAAVAVVLYRDWETVDTLGVGLLGVLTVLIAGNVYSSLSSMGGVSSEILEISAGFGLHLTLLGGILLVVAGAQGYRNDEDASSREQVAESS